MAMKRVLAVLLPAIVLCTPALAQEVAEETAKDLWCGIAFGIISAEAPADITEDQKAMVAKYAEGGVMLIDRAKGVHLTAGFTVESFAAHLETVTADVSTQIHAPGNTAKYSFEECSALIDLT